MSKSLRHLHTPYPVLSDIDLGLEEALYGPGVKVVEWAERLPFPVDEAVELRLRRGDGEVEREIEELTTIQEE